MDKEVLYNKWQYGEHEASLCYQKETWWYDRMWGDKGQGIRKEACRKPYTYIRGEGVRSERGEQLASGEHVVILTKALG